MPTIKIYDNQGHTFDRYTIIIDGSVIGMSSDPFSPLGFNQYCGDFDYTPDEQDKEVNLFDLPQDVQKAIQDRLN